jgi:transcriptional regulator with XRE-family HTH domain
LRERRLELGWTLNDLMRKSGIPKGHLSSIENGLARTSLETIALLAKTLELSLDSLVHGIALEPRKNEGKTKRPPKRENSTPGARGSAPGRGEP